MVSEFLCLDGHTCGNPVRLVVEGGPELEGSNMSEKRLFFLEHYDWIRKGLMFEPRGHDMMSGSFLYPPHNPKNDAAILFIETSGCLPMCGHGTIGTVTMAIQEGLITPKVEGKLNLETPAGLVKVEYEMSDNRVEWVKIRNIASFLDTEKIEFEFEPLGTLIADVSYGGNYYAIIDIQDNYKGLDSYKALDLIKWSPGIRDIINSNFQFVHPEDSSINGLSHLLWTGSIIDPSADARNAVFYGDKAIDRSPCGTGTSARMAQWYSRGLLKKGDSFIHESIIGSQFIGTVEEEIEIGGKPGIIPSIKGWARLTGRNKIIIDDEDPYSDGFLVI